MPGLLGYALEGAGENIGNALTNYGLLEIKSQIDKDREMALIEARKVAAIDQKRQEVGIAQQTANTERQRVAGLIGTGDIKSQMTNAMNSGDVETAKNISGIDVAQRNADTSGAKEKAIEGYYAGKLENERRLRDIQQQNADTKAGGKSGLAQEKWDRALLDKHIKDNDAFYAMPNPMDPQGKAQVNPTLKQAYSSLVLKMGDGDKADTVFYDIMQAAKAGATDASGKLDDEKFRSLYEKGAGALYKQMVKGSPVNAEPGAKPQTGGLIATAAATPKADATLSETESAERYLDIVDQLKSIGDRNDGTYPQIRANLKARLAKFEQAGWNLDHANKVMARADETNNMMKELDNESVRQEEINRRRKQRRGPF